MSEMRLPIGAPEEEATPNTSKPVGFVQRELARLAVELANPQEPEIYAQLYIAQQALAWALEPGGFASPSDVIDRDLVQPVTDTQSLAIARLREGVADKNARHRNPNGENEHES